MISLEDCKGLCGLTEAEIRAIAEHEHLPEIVAVEMGAYLAEDGLGQEAIRAMIEDDIRSAVAAADAGRALALRVCLHQSICRHPAAERRKHAGTRLPERHG